MRRIPILATIPVAALLVAGAVGAQEDTGQREGEPRLVPPEECQTAEPRPVEELMVVLGLDETAAAATPAPRTGVAAPLGDPAAGPTRDGVNATVRGLLACLNAGDIPRTASFMSDNGARRFFGSGPRTAAATEAARAMISAEPQARPLEGQTRLLAVTDISLLPDGRAAAFVVINEPALPPGGPETLLMIFVEQDGAWLLDDYFDFTIMAPDAAGTPEAAGTPAAE